MGTQRNVTIDMDPEAVKVVEDNDLAAEPRGGVRENTGPVRSQKYRQARARVDKTRKYSVEDAVALAKTTSYSNFTGTLEAHGVMRNDKATATVTFPHSIGKQRVVAIADEDTLAEIEAGNIDFDVLLAEPSMMSKLAKHAPVLGPRGLMPNPKDNTIVDDPEARKKELEAGAMTIRTERKAPLIHVPFGSDDMPVDKLVENLETLITAFKKDLKKLTIAASMGPGVKVSLEAYRTETKS
jgi:large subunit ribosomal protein L1